MKTETIKVTMDSVKVVKIEEKEGKYGEYKLLTVVDTVDMEQHTFCDRTGGLVQYEKDDIGALKLKIELKRWQSDGKWCQGYDINVIGFSKS